MVHPDAALEKEHPNLLGNDRHAEERSGGGIADQLRPAAVAAPAQSVVGQEGVFEGGSSALNLRRGAAERRHAAPVCEGRHRPPSGRRRLRPGIDGAQPVAPDARDIHPLDRGIVEREPGRDNQVVVGEALTRGRGDAPRVRIDRVRLLLHPSNAGGNEIGGRADHVARALEPGCDQREAWLVEMLLARIDQRDLRPLKPPRQAPGRGEARGTRAENDDPRPGAHRRPHRGGGTGSSQRRNRGEQGPAAKPAR